MSDTPEAPGDTAEAPGEREESQGDAAEALGEHEESFAQGDAAAALGGHEESLSPVSTVPGTPGDAPEPVPVVVASSAEECEEDDASPTDIASANDLLNKLIELGEVKPKSKFPKPAKPEFVEECVRMAAQLEPVPPTSQWKNAEPQAEPQGRGDKAGVVFSCEEARAGSTAAVLSTEHAAAAKATPASGGLWENHRSTLEMLPSDAQPPAKATGKNNYTLPKPKEQSFTIMVMLAQRAFLVNTTTPLQNFQVGGVNLRTNKQGGMHIAFGTDMGKAWQIAKTAAKWDE